MTSGVGEFSISAVKDIGKESTAKELLATGEGVQNFFVVLPGSGNETVAIPFHNGYPDALRDHLKLSAVFRSEGAPLPGW